MVVVAELGKRLGPSLWCRWAQAGAAPDETELDEEEEDSKDLLDAVGECCWPSWRPSGCSSGLNLTSTDLVIDSASSSPAVVVSKVSLPLVVFSLVKDSKLVLTESLVLALLLLLEAFVASSLAPSSSSSSSCCCCSSPGNADEFAGSELLFPRI